MMTATTSSSRWRRRSFVAGASLLLLLAAGSAYFMYDRMFTSPADAVAARGQAGDKTKGEKAKLAGPVSSKDNPDARSVVEGWREGKGPLPEPFDEAEFEADPDAYLAQIVPARAFAGRPPGRDVPYIKEISKRSQFVEPGAKAELAVQVVPRAPVTFTSLDLGQFPNQLTSVNVRADSHGIARTVFVAPPTQGGYVRIMASSPITSGVMRFMLRVGDPDSHPENMHPENIRP